MCSFKHVAFVVALFACVHLQVGVVNSLAFSSSGSFLVAAVSREHRLGRWWCMKEAKNRIAVVKLSKTKNVER